ncbi:glycerophosphodiester phosphodiesterase [Phenylobacterium montanum]|uniref:glycerophosphodiester phosphodiesterase n=1 Tax=Phenylobacterium montanum TaxID=2823693 RepID=UPI0035E3F4C6
MLTRRTVVSTAGALGAAAAIGAGPAVAKKARRKPIVIAHRGCSGERPEESRLAYELAIDEGADFIEPDLCPTKDGHLVCRHEPEIGGTTDVAHHPEFADRKKTLVIDGESITGWFTQDFTLEELKTLRCRERLPEIRPDSAKFDGQAPILTYQEVVDIARAGTRRTGRTVGTYPEMKHPTFFASIGLPLEHRLAHLLKINNLSSRSAPVFVQCFEVGALKTFSHLSAAPRVQLIDNEGGPADLPKLTYAEMVTPAGLKQVRAYADAIGPNQAMVLDFNAQPKPKPTSLVADAHKAGVMVHSWTARKENFFLPKSLQIGDPAAPDFARQTGDIDYLLGALYATGIDGVFSDFSSLNLKARNAYLASRAHA